VLNHITWRLMSIKRFVIRKGPLVLYLGAILAVHSARSTSEASSEQVCDHGSTTGAAQEQRHADRTFAWLGLATLLSHTFSHRCAVQADGCVGWREQDLTALDLGHGSDCDDVPW
jgi:hypothetical protein